MNVQSLPTLNAVLNGTAAVLLSYAYVMIRRRRIAAHRAGMIAAFLTSTAFLVSYVVYHAEVGSKLFTGQGPIRTVYFTVLITHVVLAGVIVPLAIITLARALGGRFALHRRIARWTLPLWLYVSVTGVAIYFFLRHNPGPP